jgi:hypothetical protein
MTKKYAEDGIHVGYVVDGAIAAFLYDQPASRSVI